MERLKHVLSAYGIHPVSIKEVTNKLYKVHDPYQTYALKKSSLTEKTISNFSLVFSMANKQQFTSVLPVYLTKEGQIFYKHNLDYYYLTPWLNQINENLSDLELKMLYENIANIHLETKRTQTIEQEKIKEQFDPFRSFCKDAEIHLLQYIQHFEKQRYMSPFELLVCTQYRDISYALKEIMKRLEHFTDIDSDTSWNVSLCHMALETSHILYPYIINWDYADWNNASMDLARFFQHEVKKYGPNQERLINQFSAYMQVNKLSIRELHFLVIHLLTPTNYLTAIQQYMSQRSSKSMTKHIIRIQQEYRIIRFGLSFSDFVRKEYETVPLDDLDI